MRNHYVKIINGTPRFGCLSETKRGIVFASDEPSHDKDFNSNSMEQAEKYVKSLGYTKINDKSVKAKDEYRPGQMVKYKNIDAKIIKKLSPEEKQKLAYKLNPDAGDYYEIEIQSKLLGNSKEVVWERRLSDADLTPNTWAVRSSFEKSHWYGTYEGAVDMAKRLIKRNRLHENGLDKLVSIDEFDDGKFIRTIRYDEFMKDSKVVNDSFVGKKISWDKKAIYGRILSENDPLTNKTAIEVDNGKMVRVSTKILENAINSGEAKIRDSRPYKWAIHYPMKFGGTREYYSDKDAAFKRAIYVAKRDNWTEEMKAGITIEEYGVEGDLVKTYHYEEYNKFVDNAIVENKLSKNTGANQPIKDSYAIIKQKDLGKKNPKIYHREDNIDAIKSAYSSYIRDGYYDMIIVDLNTGKEVYDEAMVKDNSSEYTAIISEIMSTFPKLKFEEEFYKADGFRPLHILTITDFGGSDKKAVFNKFSELGKKYRKTVDFDKPYNDIFVEDGWTGMYEGYIYAYDSKKDIFTITTPQGKAIKVKGSFDPKEIILELIQGKIPQGVKVVDIGLKDTIEVTKEIGSDKIIYIMQSDVDKNLYFYIGKTYSMKEGEWTYAKYKMNGMSPVVLYNDLKDNGWHPVSNGPAKVIDEKAKDSLSITDTKLELWYNTGGSINREHYTIEKETDKEIRIRNWWWWDDKNDKHWTFNKSDGKLYQTKTGKKVGNGRIIDAANKVNDSGEKMKRFNITYKDKMFNIVAKDTAHAIQKTLKYYKDEQKS